MIAVALLAFCWFGQFVSLSAREAPQLKVDEAPLPSDGRPFTFAPVIKKVSPSVVNIAPGSPAAEAGLKLGDVILESNRESVKNADDAVTKSRAVPNTRVLLRVWSGGSSHYVVLEATHR